MSVSEATAHIIRDPARTEYKTPFVCYRAAEEKHFAEPILSSGCCTVVYFAVAVLHRVYLPQFAKSLFFIIMLNNLKELWCQEQEGMKYALHIPLHLYSKRVNCDFHIIQHSFVICIVV
jgi:hypothetical protein